MNVILREYPSDRDWCEVYFRAMVTANVSYDGKPVPDAWRRRILKARHSPIRYLRFSFVFEGIPSNVATHLCRHIHAQPYVSTLRNDRQNFMNGDAAPRNSPVNMVLDVNAEELMVIANKRLCRLASEKTREVVELMCARVLDACPELQGLLVPMCIYHGHTCHEMKSCGFCPRD